MIKHAVWTIHGGPNNGLKIRFKPDGNDTQTVFGADRYTVRHHDRILLFGGYDPTTDDAAWNELLDEELKRSEAELRVWEARMNKEERELDSFLDDFVNE